MLLLNVESTQSVEDKAVLYVGLFIRFEMVLKSKLICVDRMQIALFNIFFLFLNVDRIAKIDFETGVCSLLHDKSAVINVFCRASLHTWGCLTELL